MKVIVKNLALEYDDRGSGPVMLLLHGWQDDLHTFDPIVPLLAPSWRIVRLDLPGFGKSEAPGRAWELDQYVSAVAEFIDKLDLHVEVLVGHSFGGRITIKGLGTGSLHAKKAVLIASAGVAKRNSPRRRFFMLIAKAGKMFTLIPPLRFVREELRKMLYKSTGSDYLKAGPLKDTFLKVVEEDLTSTARTVSVPTLLIWGDADTETPLSEGKLLSNLIRVSSLEVFGGAGHFVHLEKPGEVAQAITHFVATT